MTRRRPSATPLYSSAASNVYKSQQLEILSELAELLSDPKVRMQLMDSHDAQQVHRLLEAWEPYRPAA